MTFSVYSVSNDICHYCKPNEKSIGISLYGIFNCNFASTIGPYKVGLVPG